MLDELPRFRNYLLTNRVHLFSRDSYFGIGVTGPRHEDDRVHCPTCGDRRRVNIRMLYPVRPTPPEGDAANSLAWLLPALFEWTCTTCDGKILVLLYDGPNGHTLMTIPSSYGAMATPRTPQSVAYYLDQAHRCKCVSAFSAAVAMFRTALDHLLFEQGFRENTLAEKIHAMRTELRDGNLAIWAHDVDAKFLEVAQYLGERSALPVDAEFAEKATLDERSCLLIQATFAYLLFVTYELPHQRESALASLHANAAALRR